jgi:hypothetical protein
MGGTTTHGWPYVTPDDHPFEYPAASQALANKLESGPLMAAQERAADAASVASDVLVAAATVILTGAVGRKVLLTAEVRYTTASTSTLWVFIKSGATVLRSIALVGHPATAASADRVISISGVTSNAPSETFTGEMKATGSTLVVRQYSGLIAVAP